MLKCKKNGGRDIVNFRVAKYHRYGRYICVKILEGWGKKCGKTCSFAEFSSWLGEIQQLIRSSGLKPAFYDNISSMCSP